MLHHLIAPSESQPSQSGLVSPFYPLSRTIPETHSRPPQSETMGGGHGDAIALWLAEHGALALRGQPRVLLRDALVDLGETRPQRNAHVAARLFDVLGASGERPAMTVRHDLIAEQLLMFGQLRAGLDFEPERRT